MILLKTFLNINEILNIDNFVSFQRMEENICTRISADYGYMVSNMLHVFVFK